MCYLMTTFRCPSDILITSWLFTASWSTWPGNHLGPIVSLARTAPALMLERQAGSSVWGSRNTRKKWTLSQPVQGKGEQCNSQVSHHRPCRGREPCHRLRQGKSGRQRGTAIDQMYKRGTLIRKTPICMNWDAGSYQLSRTWDQVISRSHAPSSCKQSRSDLDVRRTSKRCH